MLGIASAGLLASSALVTPALSAPYVLQDTYYGGDTTSVTNANPAYISGGDTVENIGTKNFQIDSAVISRPNANTLTVTINTWYAGQPPLDGTNYGSLFFGSASAFNAAVPNNTLAGTANDTFHPGLWTSAFVVTSGNNGALYNTTGPNTANLMNGVAKTYTETFGQIVMSNVNGDPRSPTSGFLFRQGQAVQFNPTTVGTGVLNTLDTNAPITGTMSVVASIFGPGNTPITEGSITYTIVDDGFLGNTFAISWAMTCANDVIQGAIPSGGLQGSTPLPAALPLFAGGLGMIGFFGSRRKKRLAAA
jgi:hypothetical protein